MSAYRQNINQLFQTFRRVLRPETLFIWTTALPVSQTVRGGVILDTIRFLSDVLRYDILLANDFTSQAAAGCGFDVIDLHYEMRRHIDLRMADGIHWNPTAHRKISALLFHHICSAWHVVLPLRISIAFGGLHAAAGGRRKSAEKSSLLGDKPDDDGESRGAAPDSTTPALSFAFTGLHATAGGRRKSLLGEKPVDGETRGAMLDFATSRLSSVPVELGGHGSVDQQHQRGQSARTPSAAGLQAINIRLLQESGTRVKP